MDDNGRGASSSLKLTIAELRRFLSSGRSANGRLRGGLRSELDQLHFALARRAFDLGFRAAHEQAADFVEQNGIFPAELAFTGKPSIAPSSGQSFAVRSKVTRAKLLKVRRFHRDVWFWETLRRQDEKD